MRPLTSVGAQVSNMSTISLAMVENSDATTIPNSSRILGDLLSGEDLDIGGLIEGNVCALRNVLIRKFARVDGTILADQIVVEGEVNGNIEARNIMLASNADVMGDLYYAEIICIEDGARHEGKTIRTQAGGLLSGAAKH